MPSFPIVGLPGGIRFVARKLFLGYFAPYAAAFTAAALFSPFVTTIHFTLELKFGVKGLLRQYMATWLVAMAFTVLLGVVTMQYLLAMLVALLVIMSIPLAFLLRRFVFGRLLSSKGV
ncbi:hypothetical protein ODZ83_01290 [Acaricomes phytoseiuli]|uniref:hypothetical protein n=1 Tax=Acaricomes phytoseiuli TaxID=291968 RepID=UPI0012EAB9FA|nr:hypothetical protein [Acaricomes phytoseiuli]MCW1248844.1 hypothetical protein [Acaricomes phytoseiuli]